MKSLTLFVFLLLMPLPYLSAQSVDILWQGNNYVAPFYKGLPLWSKQSEITFVAVPHGLGNPANLNYVWSRNGTVLGTVSGVGRSSLTFLDSILSKPVTIMVEIMAPQEQILAENTLTLTPTAPALYVYENHPLYGFVFHREVGESFALEEAEVTFTGFPFFFSAQSRVVPNLIYQWKNNSVVGETKSSVTYRTPEKVSGSASVELGLKDINFLAQTASKKFLVKFGNDEN